jgi:hypothetical protein
MILFDGRLLLILISHPNIFVDSYN